MKKIEIKLKNDLLKEKEANEIVKVIVGELPKDFNLSDTDLGNLVEILRFYFWNASPLSRDIVKELGIDREKLIELFKIFKRISLFQNVLSNYSMERRLISFTRELLLPENISYLEHILHASNVIPFAIEFHLAHGCNLKCKGCPNIYTLFNPQTKTGEWKFRPYHKIADSLDLKRLKMIIDMFLSIEVRRFNFAGGGEPCIESLTFDGIKYLKEASEKKNLTVHQGLYTNGVFDPGLSNEKLKLLIECIGKIRFSIDATNKDDWFEYKSGTTKQYNLMRSNLQNLVQIREPMESKTKIGASCLVSIFTFDKIPSLLKELREDGVDFCDIKELAISSEDKHKYKPDDEAISNKINTIMDRVENAEFAPLHIVFDDSFNWYKIEREKRNKWYKKTLKDRCWVAINGRIMTVGPHGELHPCCDSDNPGFQKQCLHPLRLGVLTDFDDPYMLKAQFQVLWDNSLKKRMLISRGNCPYCVPSNFNYNYVMEKLYQDWAYGIPLESQPVAPEKDQYNKGRGIIT